MAKVIIDSWIGEAIDDKAIIQACLLHDIAKPMNFDPAKQAQFGMSEADIEKLEKLQKEMRNKYGEEEHKATVSILKDVGCSAEAVELVDNLEWKYTSRLLKEERIESLIPIYCDMRVAPKGILPLLDRMEELRRRERDADDMDELIEVGLKLEELLNTKVSIELDQITDEQMNQYVDEFRSVEV